MLAEGSFGEAGREIVVEDFLQGEELSSWPSPMASGSCSSAAQDHKGWARATRGEHRGMAPTVPEHRHRTALERVRRACFAPRC